MCLKDALSHDGWRKAMYDEMTTLHCNETRAPLDIFLRLPYIVFKLKNLECFINFDARGSGYSRGKAMTVLRV
jgi:hypothetical protein